jgi:hypothetical protein
MPSALFAVVVVVFVVVGVVYVRSTQKRAIGERLPVDQDENILLDEKGLKIFHRSRRLAIRGGGTLTHRVRVLLTDRRILVVSGGPEGKHKFVILMILDYTVPAPPVLEAGYAAYKTKFRLDNGYPTYAFSAADVSLDEQRGGGVTLRIDVPFPERGPKWGDPPEVKIYTQEAKRYQEAVARHVSL